MDGYFASWMLLAAVMFAAVISPGPDFVMAVRNSLLHGRRAGLFTALGFGFGAAVHASYASAGLGAMMAHAAWLFVVIKYIGAGYLIYLGIQALRSQGASVTSVESAMSEQEAKSKGDLAALRDGFITNLFNPKAVMFFIALFTQIIDPATPAVVMAGYIATCMLIIVGWFSVVAYLMTLAQVRARYLAYSRAIDRVLGVFLIGFGFKLAFSRV
jgi:RhtB (resistance to homoserine/threonine) family protein